MLKHTREAIRARVQRTQRIRVEAKRRGRLPVPIKPAPREVDESQERWDALRHDVPDRHEQR